MIGLTAKSSFSLLISLRASMAPRRVFAGASHSCSTANDRLKQWVLAFLWGNGLWCGDQRSRSSKPAEEGRTAVDFRQAFGGCRNSVRRW